MLEYFGLEPGTSSIQGTKTSFQRNCTRTTRSYYNGTKPVRDDLHFTLQHPQFPQMRLYGNKQVISINHSRLTNFWTRINVSRVLDSYIVSLSKVCVLV